MRNHRSLLAWQKAHSLTKMVIQLSLVAWKPVFAAIFGQLQKSSLSIQLNIAEGYAFGDSATFRRHLRIAYGSAVESGDLLNLMSEIEGLNRAEVGTAVQICDETQKLLFGLMKKYGAVAMPGKTKKGPSPSA
jgi:four helix bundle protein